MKWGPGMAVLLGLAVLGVLGVMHLRSQERLGELQRHKFADVKLRVTDDVLREYRAEERRLAAAVARISRDELGPLEAEVARLEGERESRRLEAVEACQGEKKRVNDQRAAVESQTDLIKSDFQEQKSAWEAEKVSLVDQREQTSKLCDYADKNSLEVRILCGLGNPPKKDQAPAAEQPLAAEHMSKNEAPPRLEPPNKDADAPKVEEKGEEEEAKVEEPPKAEGDAQKADDADADEPPAAPKVKREVARPQTEAPLQKAEAAAAADDKAPETSDPPRAAKAAEAPAVEAPRNAQAPESLPKGAPKEKEEPATEEEH